MRTNGSAVVEFCRGGEFIETMRRAGLEPPTLIKPGKFYRFPGIGKKHGNVDGWCLLFDDEQGGVFGNWSTGLSETWQAQRERAPQEQEAFNRQVVESRKQAAAEQKAAQAEAAAHAAEILERSTPAPADFPYLVRKQMRPYGLRLDGDRLVVALRDTGGNLRTIQYIDADGTKRLLKGGAFRGNFWTLGDITSETPFLYVGEGTSTCAAVHAAMESPVIAAMSAHNLKPVAEALRKRYPGARIVVCADDDFEADGNPGVKAAGDAANAVGGLLVVPQFSPDLRESGMTDWCDLMLIAGLKEVKKQIDGYLESVDKFEAPPPPVTTNRAEDERIIAELAALPLLEYERIRRAKAEELGIGRTHVLDKLVAERREKMQAESEEDSPIVEELTLWKTAVDARELVDNMEATISQHIALPPGACPAIVLWCFGTYLMDIWALFAKLLITSPEKRCGKTNLLLVLEGLCYHPLMTSNITVSALFRSIDEWAPTLLIDESDTFVKDDDALNGLINSGHMKRSAFTLRSEKVGDGFKVRKFSTWCPEVFAGIGDQRGTLCDRSIRIEIRRRLPNETVKKIPVKYFEQQSATRQKALRWCQDNSDAVRKAHPTVPHSGNDREQDNWTPLFRLAEVIGGRWPEKTLSAYHAIVEHSTEDDGAAVKLLADIRDIFTEHMVEVMHSADLVERLVELESRPWSEWRRGRPVTQNSLAKLLRPFNIRSSQLKIGGTNRHGYRRTDFEDSWNRYLNLYTPASNDTPLQSQKNNELDENKALPSKSQVADEKPPKPNEISSVAAVAFETGVYRDVPQQALIDAATRACAGLKLSAGEFITELDPEDYQEIVSNPALARATAQSLDLRK